MNFRTYRTCLRLEFDYSCAYCLARESEVGPGSDYGGFEIEHFRPMGRPEFGDLKHVYANLLWACALCNRAKGARWPSPEEEALGYYFVDPCAEALGNHLMLEGEMVMPRTKAGTFMKEEINLNSAAHRERRRARAAVAEAIALIDELIERDREDLGKVTDEPAQQDLQKRIAAAMKARDQLWPAKPWDPVSTCACNEQPAAEA